MVTPSRRRRCASEGCEGEPRTDRRGWSRAFCDRCTARLIAQAFGS